jgi:hypothetical protein
VLGWLLWAAWVTPPPQVPLISPTGLNAVANEVIASPATIRNAAAGVGGKIATRSSDRPSLGNKG